MLLEVFFLKMFMFLGLIRAFTSNEPVNTEAAIFLQLNEICKIAIA